MKAIILLPIRQRLLLLFVLGRKVFARNHTYCRDSFGFCSVRTGSSFVPFILTPPPQLLQWKTSPLQKERWCRPDVSPIPVWDTSCCTRNLYTCRTQAAVGQFTQMMTEHEIIVWLHTSWVLVPYIQDFLDTWCDANWASTPKITDAS